MQTNFLPELLADPAMKESERVLRTCVHCGFCTATCPTYLLLGDELDSPRGRIYLMKEMLEQNKPATEEVVTHIDRCLSCLSCMTTCPSGVNYMHLVDHAREHIEKTYKRSLPDRLMRLTLAKILPYPRRFRLAMIMGALAKPFAPILRSLPAGDKLTAMLALVPTPLPRPLPENPSQPVGVRRGRVVLPAGCAQSVLDPGINAAAARLITRLGFEVVRAKGEACCGSLVHHMGREHESQIAAKRNIDAWIAEMDRGALDAIVITTSGCGTTIKEYGFTFRNDPAYAEKAARVSAITKDVTEFLAGLNLAPPPEPHRLTVAYHAACSLQHGQQVKTAPKQLLARAGFVVRDVPEGHICCGSAGTYNILQPEIARRLRDRKVGNIERLRPDVIATGNIGCITQIGSGTPIPILHTVELLDWAYGGPEPRALAQAGPLYSHKGEVVAEPVPEKTLQPV
jgi:glycolate oxidase iron-sulfur subunit